MINDSKVLAGSTWAGQRHNRRNVLKVLAGIPFLGFLPKVKADETRPLDLRPEPYKDMDVSPSDLRSIVRFNWHKSSLDNEINTNWATSYMAHWPHHIDYQSDRITIMRAVKWCWLDEKYKGWAEYSKIGHPYWGWCHLVHDIWYKKTTKGWEETPITPAFYLVKSDFSKR